MTMPKCRKCGWPIMAGEYRFGSPATGWEHMEGECMSPAIEPGSSYIEKMTAPIVLSDEDEQMIADLMHRELTDAEEAAEEATWD